MEDHSGTIERHAARREALSFLFVSAALLAALGGLAAGVWYATPRVPYVEIGAVEDFPRSTEPYPVKIGDFEAWVVNTGGEIIVFAPVTPRLGGCRFKWLPERSQFRDPCLGTAFRLTGETCSGPPSRDLDRYAIRLRGERLLVEAWRTFPGEEYDPSRVTPCGPASLLP